MKEFKEWLLIYVSALLVIYIHMALYTLELNFLKWSEGVRFVFTILSACIFLTTLLAAVDLNKNKP